MYWSGIANDVSYVCVCNTKQLFDASGPKRTALCTQQMLPPMCLPYIKVKVLLMGEASLIRQPPRNLSCKEIWVMHRHVYLFTLFLRELWLPDGTTPKKSQNGKGVPLHS